MRSVPIPCSPRRRVTWARRVRGARSPCGALQQGLRAGKKAPRAGLGGARRRPAGPGAGGRASGRRLLAARCQCWRCAGRVRAAARGRGPGLRRRRRTGPYARVRLCLRAAVGRVWLRHACAPAYPCPVCSWRMVAACVCTGVPMPCMLVATRMRVVRVGVYVACSCGPCARRYALCHWVRTSARCRQPGYCKNPDRGFPEVLPKTALCAGYLSQGKASFSAVCLSSLPGLKFLHRQFRASTPPTYF